MGLLQPHGRYRGCDGKSGLNKFYTGVVMAPVFVIGIERFTEAKMSEKLEDIARALVAPGKGILAADESTSTIKKRFDTIKLASSEDSRRDYREMLFRANEGMKNYVSGVILYDETIRQKAKDGTPLVDIMKAAGSLPGIKVDT